MRFNGEFAAGTIQVISSLDGHFGTRTLRHQDTSAPVPNCRTLRHHSLVPKYLGTEMSWCRSVRLLFLLSRVVCSSGRCHSSFSGPSACLQMEPLSADFRQTAYARVFKKQLKTYYLFRHLTTVVYLSIFSFY